MIKFTPHPNCIDVSVDEKRLGHIERKTGNLVIDMSRAKIDFILDLADCQKLTAQVTNTTMECHPLQAVG